jgi:protein required for attachment to host cells
MRRRHIWIATFNGAECRLYDYDGASRSLKALEDDTLVGPHRVEHRDRATRVYSSADERRSASGKQTDAERALEDAFVAKVTDLLSAACAAGRFDDVIVAAGPRALGAFRKLAPKALMKHVVREIDGDFVGADAEEILAALWPR